MTLGQRIKERRQLLGITQQELASVAQITLQHISSIEQNKRFPSVPLLIKLSENLSASLDYLVFGKETKTDLISAIEDDEILEAQQKNSLINLVVVMRGKKNKQS